MDEQLGAVLAVLVARTGAQAARVVDARGGGVLAQVGAIAPADVCALVAQARDVVPLTGGPEDLVLPTPTGVHVLRAFPGAFVHLRVGAGPDVAVARGELASPALHRAVGGALAVAVRHHGLVAVPDLPRPRHAQPDPAAPPLQRDHRPRPHPRTAPQPRTAQPRTAQPHTTEPRRPEPALAVLGSAPDRAERLGSLALLAPVPDAGVTAPVTLPHRAVTAPVTRPHPVVARPLALPEVLAQEWAVDAATMSRLLDGLRRLT